MDFLPFPFWDPFGTFWVLGGFLLMPFSIVAWLLWCLFDKLFPPQSWVRRQTDKIA